MLEAARTGKLGGLYVAGANPIKTFASGKDKSRGTLDLFIVHEMFLTETAALADIVFPAESAYEKDGTVTNTAGEDQLLPQGGAVIGPPSAFEIPPSLSDPIPPIRH